MLEKESHFTILRQLFDIIARTKESIPLESDGAVALSLVSSAF